MDNQKMKKIIFATECAALLAVTVMLIISARKALVLSRQISSLNKEISVLKEDAAANETMTQKENPEPEKSADKQIKESASAAEVTRQPEPTAAPSPTVTPMPTSTPVPTATPLPEYLLNLDDCQPGDIIEDAMIDPEDPGRYFTSSIIEEGDLIFDRIIGRSFQYNDNIALYDLRYIKLLHRNFNAQTQVGELIVNAAIEEDVLDIFMQLYLNDYQICSMYLIDDFWAGDGDSSDFASIEADNTSAFCYRTVTGSSSNLSNHAYGLAIDLNPLENPYVRFDGDGYGTSSHAYSQAYENNRSSETPHVIDHDDFACQLFLAHGFTWGGDWSNPKDYQHFQKELY